MQPLSASELAGMRETVMSIETTSVEVWRRQTVPDAGGGQTDTYVLFGIFECMYYRSANAGNAERVGLIDRVVVSEDYTFTFPVRTDIRHDDRLKADGKTFEVKSLTQGTDGLEVVMTIGANEVL